MLRHKWHHAANTAAKIEATFHSDNKYDSIEVDVSNVNGILQLAHSANVLRIDTTLSEFLDRIKEVQSAFTIKFDFKDTESIRSGMSMIKRSRLSEHTRHSYILNADTAVGPGGKKNVIMSTGEFIALARTQLPTFLISIGMTTGWDIKTLFLAHSYHVHHIDRMVGLTNCTLALNMAILSQTNPDIISRISDNNILVWGEDGVMEAAWLRNNPSFSIQRDLQGVGLWLSITYAWFLVWMSVLAYIIMRVTVYVFDRVQYKWRVRQNYTISRDESVCDESTGLGEETVTGSPRGMCTKLLHT